MEEDVVEDYKSSLRDLNCNSKPLINMLTMLAEDNVKQAPKIVQLIESHLAKVGPEVKLPVMYLIDSIIKNVGDTYLQLFTQNIVSVFCSVFEKVDEKTRMQLFKLRQTWSEIFPPKKMYGIDIRVKAIDPAWPVLTQSQPAAIHVNPKFLETKQPTRVHPTPTLQQEQPRPTSVPIRTPSEEEVHQQLMAKQAELLKLQQQKLQLDLLRLKEQAHTLQTSKPPTAQVAPLLPKDPRLARRDPRNVGAATRISFRDPRLGSRPVVPTLQSAVAPVTPTSKVEAFPKERTTVSRHVTPPIPCEPLTVSKKIDSPKKDVTVASKDNKSISSVVKVPSQSSPTKESSHPPKHTDQKTNEKSSPKSKLQSISKTPSSKQREKTTTITTTTNTATEVEPHKIGKDKLDSPSDDKAKKKLSPDTKGKKKSPSDKGSQPEATKDATGKHKDTKKRSPKSPSKKDNRKARDLSPNKKSEKRGGKKSLESGKNRQLADEASASSAAEVLKNQQPQDVDLRVLQQQQQNVDNKSSESTVNKDPESSKSRTTTSEEPPTKKPKTDRVDSLFGEEDQDLRMLTSKFSEDEEDDEDAAVEILPMERPRQKNWAQYKAAYPDEFKSPLRPAKENIQGPVDKDFRIHPFSGHRDPKRPGLDRLGRPLLNRNRRPSLTHWHNNIPREDQDLLILSREPELLREADQHLQAGLISPREHQMVVARVGQLRSRFPQDPVWLNSSKSSPQRIENGSSLLTEDSCPNMMNRLPPSKPIFIDGKMRNITFYGERAIVEMDDNKPHQITFTGTNRMVFLDDKVLFVLSFGETREFAIHGRQHTIKFGSPSREVYLDGVPHSATFGGDPFMVVLDGIRHQMKLGGPPPNVELSEEPVIDLTEDLPMKREELLDVDMRDAFLQRGPSPVNDKMASSILDEKLEDIDMRVPMASSQRQPPENVKETNESTMNFIQQNQQPQQVPQQQQQQQQQGQQQQQQQQPQPPQHILQGLGPNWEPSNWMNREFRSSPRQEWGSPVRDQGLVDGQDRISAPSNDWHPQQEPMDWECKAADQQRLKYQTFRPEEAQRRDTHNREWDWRQEFSNSNSPKRYEEFSSQGPMHREAHLQGPHQGHMLGPQRPPLHHPMGGPRQMAPHPTPRPMGSHQGPMTSRPSIHPGGMHQGGMMEHLGGPPLQGSHPDIPPEVAHQGPHMGPHSGHPSTGGPLLQTPEAGGPRMGPHNFIQYGGGAVHLQHRPPGGMRPRFPNMRFPQERPGNGGRMFAGVPRFIAPERPQFVPMHPKDMSIPSGPAVNISQDVTGLVHSEQSQDSSQPTEQPPPALLDVTALLSKLIATGIISSTTSSTTKPENSNEQDQSPKEIPPIELLSECLKTRHPGVMVALYTGMQCASCGMRFQDCQQDKYSQHLDWHFRSNRREKDGVKKAFSRKWFYDVEDWVQFEELEDLEDRAPSLFEIQADEEQFQTTNEPVELPSVVAHENSADNVCSVCNELLELIWVEEAEEWHLRGAVRHDGKTYHPLCYQDFQKAQEIAETPTDVPETNPLETPGEDGAVVIKTEPEDPPEEPSENIQADKPEDQTQLDGTVEQEVNEEPKPEESTDQDSSAKAENEQVVTEEQVMDTSDEKPAEEEFHLEEEIIGVINSDNEDNGDEDDLEDGEIRPEPEMVVIQSGGITLKVRAESIAIPTNASVASPSGNANNSTNSGEPGPAGKEDIESGELVDTGAQDETDTEDEFVPPPPDPRFHVLPPVQRGKELSGLCSIM